MPTPVRPHSAPVPAPWRLSMLAIDELPGRYAPLYAEWVARGARLEIETSFDVALARLRHGRYTLVVVPLLANAYGSPAVGTFVGDYLERWIEDYAPNYRHRLVYLGPPDAATAALAHLARSAGSAPPTSGVFAETLLVAPFLPDAAAVAQATDQLDLIVKRLTARREQAQRAAKAGEA